MSNHEAALSGPNSNWQVVRHAKRVEAGSGDALAENKAEANQSRDLPKKRRRFRPRGKKQDRQQGSTRAETNKETSKRLRSDGSGSSTPQNKRGRFHRTPISSTAPVGPAPKPPSEKYSYREAAERHLKVAVIDRTHPLGRFSQERARIVESRLNDLLDEELFREVRNAAGPPTFRGWMYRQEILWITCENGHSLEWLKKTIACLPPPWETARLDLVQVDKLPKLKKASVFLPGPQEEESKVLRRLGAQNPWAKVDNWCVMHQTSAASKDGMVMVFGIDQATEDAISERKGLVHYKFSTLTVRIRAAEESSATEEAQMEAPPERAALGAVPTVPTVLEQEEAVLAPTPTSSSETLVLDDQASSAMVSMDTSSFSEGELKLPGLSQDSASQ